MLAVAPFDAQAATAGYRGPTSDPSTLVQNGDGTWTRTYPDGTVIQFNSSGQETSEADRNGNTTTYAYFTSGAAAGALHTITDPVGLVTTLAYDSSGHLSTITDPAGRVTTITVDSNDNLTSIADPDDAVTGYGYSTPSNHLITTETDPNDNTATAPLQQLRPVDQRDPLRRHVEHRRRRGPEPGPVRPGRRGRGGRSRSASRPGHRDRPRQQHDDAELQLDGPPHRRERPRHRRHDDHHLQPARASRSR